MEITTLLQWRTEDGNNFQLGAVIRIETQRAIPKITHIYAVDCCDETMVRLLGHDSEADGGGVHPDCVGSWDIR